MHFTTTSKYTACDLRKLLLSMSLLTRWYYHMVAVHSVTECGAYTTCSSGCYTTLSDSAVENWCLQMYIFHGFHGICTVVSTNYAHETRVVFNDIFYLEVFDIEDSVKRKLSPDGSVLFAQFVHKEALTNSTLFVPCRE